MTTRERAEAVRAAAAEIDAAIVAKGGTTAGGLRNAAAAIAALPSGGGDIWEGYRRIMGANDGELVIPSEARLVDYIARDVTYEGPTDIVYYGDYIGELAFYNTKNLRSVVANGIKSINEKVSVFHWSSIETFESETLESIVYNGWCRFFQNCYLLKTVRMNSLTVISPDTFFICPKIEHVELKSLRVLANYTFEGIENGADVYLHSVDQTSHSNGFGGCLLNVHLEHQTCSELIAGSNFPYGIATYSGGGRFFCTDGYVAYENGSWIAHTED